MKRTVSTIVLILISAFLCYGQGPQKFTSIKDAIQQRNYHTFCIKAHFAGIHDSAKLIFFIEEDDYVIPVRLQKKDLGAERRFLAMDLKEGDVIVVKGMLNDIDIDYETYKGLVDAVILDEEELIAQQANSEGFSLQEGDIVVKPEFNGGDANRFSEWVNYHLVYPPKALSKGIHGCVTLQFSVEADGSVANVIVIRGVYPELDAEAVRVVSSSPKWKPAYLNGEPTRITYTFPVCFSL